MPWGMIAPNLQTTARDMEAASAFPLRRVADSGTKRCANATEWSQFQALLLTKRSAARDSDPVERKYREPIWKNRTIGRAPLYARNGARSGSVV